MTDQNCYTRDDLREFALGITAEQRSDVIAKHLLDCDVCEETLVSLEDAADTLIGEIRQSNTDEIDVHINPDEADKVSADDAAAGASYRNAIRSVKSIEIAKSAELPGIESQPLSGDGSLPDDATNALLRDYRLLEPIGQGGMGTVYKAVHSRLNRLFAIKILPSWRLRDTTSVTRFQREMLAIGQMNHPAIVQATDAGEIDETHYLVMEFIDGVDLSKLRLSVPSLRITDACEMARATAVGLAYAHRQGTIHRDIKPSNLMLTRDGDLKILDLGLALLGDDGAEVDHLTTVGQLMGTLDYMAPEQCDNSHRVDHHADVYSLGATLYKLLTGYAPYADGQSRSPVRKLRAIALDDVPPISEHRDDIPTELAETVMRMLARNPSDRLADMNAVADALQPFCDEADLHRLVSTALKQKDLGTDETDTAPSLADALASSGIAHLIQTDEPDLDADRPSDSAPNVVAAGDVGAGDRWLRWLSGAAAMGFVVFLGILITLETQKGTLTIQSTLDDVQVRIKQGDRVASEMQLTMGANTARIAAGQYRIEVIGRADSAVVTDGQFELLRGDTHVAKIELIESVGADTAASNSPDTELRMMSPAVSAPTYQGRTLAQWLDEIAGEQRMANVSLLPSQNPKYFSNVSDAVRALNSTPADQTLVNKHLAFAETALHLERSPPHQRILVQIMFAIGPPERHDVVMRALLGIAPDISLLPQGTGYNEDADPDQNFAFGFINGLNADAAMPVAVAELSSGTIKSRAFALAALGKWMSDDSDRNASAVSVRSDHGNRIDMETLANSLAQIARTDVPQNRWLAILLLRQLHANQAENVDGLAAKVKQAIAQTLLDTCVASMDDPDTQTAWTATLILAQTDPENTTLVDRVQSILHADNTTTSHLAVHVATEMARSSDAALESLTTFLQDSTWGNQVRTGNPFVRFGHAFQFVHSSWQSSKAGSVINFTPFMSSLLTLAGGERIRCFEPRPVLPLSPESDPLSLEAELYNSQQVSKPTTLVEMQKQYYAQQQYDYTWTSRTFALFQIAELGDLTERSQGTVEAIKSQYAILPRKLHHFVGVALAVASGQPETRLYNGHGFADWKQAHASATDWPERTAALAGMVATVSPVAADPNAETPAGQNDDASAIDLVREILITNESSIFDDVDRKPESTKEYSQRCSAILADAFRTSPDACLDLVDRLCENPPAKQNDFQRDSSDVLHLVLQTFGTLDGVVSGGQLGLSGMGGGLTDLVTFVIRGREQRISRLFDRALDSASESDRELIRELVFGRIGSYGLESLPIDQRLDLATRFLDDPNSKNFELTLIWALRLPAGTPRQPDHRFWKRRFDKVREYSRSKDSNDREFGIHMAHSFNSSESDQRFRLALDWLETYQPSDSEQAKWNGRHNFVIGGLADRSVVSVAAEIVDQNLNTPVYVTLLQSRKPLGSILKVLADLQHDESTNQAIKRIRDRFNGESTDDHASERRYEDKTFEQWRQTLMTELKIERQQAAMEAMAHLGRYDHQVETFNAIFDFFERQGFEALPDKQADFYDFGDVVRLRYDAIDTLAAVWSPAFAPELAKRLASENRASQQLSMYLLSNLNSRIPERIGTSLLDSTGLFVTPLLDFASVKSKSDRCTAISALAVFGAENPDQIKPVFLGAIADADREIRLCALAAWSKTDFDPEPLGKVIDEVMQTLPESGSHSQQFGHLFYVYGPRMAFVAPKLIENLTNDIKIYKDMSRSASTPTLELAKQRLWTAIQSLGAIGPKANAALPLLRSIESDEQLGVYDNYRRAAADAIDAITGEKNQRSVIERPGGGGRF